MTSVKQIISRARRSTYHCSAVPAVYFLLEAARPPEMRKALPLTSRSDDCLSVTLFVCYLIFSHLVCAVGLLFGAGCLPVH